MGLFHLGFFFSVPFVKHCIESSELEQELQKAFVPQLIPEKQAGILILSSSAPLVQRLPSLGRRKEGGWRGVAGGKVDGWGWGVVLHARTRSCHSTRQAVRTRARAFPVSVVVREEGKFPQVVLHHRRLKLSNMQQAVGG